jgi:hypothetical protein
LGRARQRVWPRSSVFSSFTLRRAIPTACFTAPARRHGVAAQECRIGGARTSTVATVMYRGRAVGSIHHRRRCHPQTQARSRHRLAHSAHHHHQTHHRRCRQHNLRPRQLTAPNTTSCAASTIQVRPRSKAALDMVYGCGWGCWARENVWGGGNAAEPLPILPTVNHPVIATHTRDARPYVWLVQAAQFRRLTACGTSFR